MTYMRMTRMALALACAASLSAIVHCTSPVGRTRNVVHAPRI